MAMEVKRDMTDALTEAVLAFNFNPVSYCHPSWLPDGAGLPRFEEFTQEPAVAGLLSKKMLQEHSIDKQFDYDFERPFKRIAFLPYRQQKKIIFRLGMAVYRDRFASVIAAGRQQQLFKVFGQDEYRLSLRLRIDHEFVSAAFTPELSFKNVLRCRVLVLAAGLCLLTNILQREPAGFKTRYYFTWPKQLVIRRLAVWHRGARLNGQQWMKLQDHALYCARHLQAPDLVDQAREMLGLLLLRGNW